MKVENENNVNSVHKEYKKFHENNKKKLIVFIHGFFGSPNQFKYWADFAYEKGYSVLCLLLPGHGGSGEYFAQNGAADWYGYVSEQIAFYSKMFDNIILVGHSMGGLFSLKLSVNEIYKVRGVVVISAPLSLKFTSRGVVNGLHVTFLPKERDNEINTSYRDANSVKGTKIFTYLRWVKQVNDLKRIMRQTEKLLPNVTCPVLILQSKGDETVNYKSANSIFDGLNCPRRRVWLNKSWHSHFTQDEREKISQEIFEFLDSNKIKYF